MTKRYAMIWLAVGCFLGCSIGGRVGDDCTDDQDCFGDEVCIFSRCISKEAADASIGDSAIDDAEGDGSKDLPDGPGSISFEAAGGTINFSGAVLNGAELEKTINIQYSGSSPVTNVHSQLEGDFQFPGGQFPGEGGTCGSTISENCSIIIGFSPQERGEVTTTLRVYYSSNDASQEVSVILLGQGLQPATLVLSNGANFSPAYVGDSSQGTVRIKNTGDVSATQVTAEFSDAQFQFTGGAYPGNEAGCPDSIEAGAECNLFLQFSPLAVKDYEAELTINYLNAIEEENLHVSLFGPTYGFVGNLGWGKNGYWRMADAFYMINTPVQAAIDSYGNLFITDSNLNAVHKFNSAGQYIGWIGGGGDHFQTGKTLPAISKGNSIYYPQGIAVDSQGNLYVTDGRNIIQKWAACGGTGSNATVCTYVGALGNGSLNGFVSGTIHWEAGLSSAGRFNMPQGVAMDGHGNLFVTDSNNQRVQKWAGCDGTGTACQYVGWLGNGADNFVREVTGIVSGSSDRKFNGPASIGVDSQGNLFIGERENNRIQKWRGCDGTSTTDLTCVYVGSIGNGSDHFRPGASSNASNEADRFIRMPQGFTIDTKGNLFVSDFWNSRVQKWLGCNQTGASASYCSYNGSIGGKNGNHFSMGIPPVAGISDRYFTNPAGIAIDSSGNLFILQPGMYEEISRKVQLWTGCGETGDIASQCYYYGWINPEAGGFITGNPPGISGAGDRFFSQPGKGVLDAHGNLYIADTNNHRVQKWLDCQTGGCTYGGWIGNGRSDFETGGSADSGTADKYFISPGSLALDHSGNLYIVDSGNHRVQKWGGCQTNTCTYAGWIGKSHSNGFSWGNTGSSDLSGNGFGEFRNPKGIILDSEGNLFISDPGNYRVQKWANCADNGTCTYVGWIGQNHLDSFQPDSSQTACSLTDGCFSDSQGLGFDTAGNLYVADAGNNRVQKWVGCAGSANNCRYTGWIGAGHIFGFASGYGPDDYGMGGSGDAEFSEPVDLAFDSAGNLYISDNMNRRVQKWAFCGGTTNSCSYAGWVGGGSERLLTGENSYYVNYYAWDKYFYPQGIFIDSVGFLYITERTRLSKWRIARNSPSE